MAKSEYLTTPLKTDKMPPGVPYIVGNEAAERFSYYGMNSILVVFMTQYLLDPSGKPDFMSDIQAETWYHRFQTWVYLLPIVGALLADAVLGKYRTIFWLSIVYCCGHFALALDHTRVGLVIGMALIALGAGGIKPCVSANVGDQFGAANRHLLTRVFSWFYFSINLGSAVSTILIPELLAKGSAALAFAIPGVLMVVATVVFWLGRKRFVHIPPAGPAIYVKEVFNRNTLKVLGNLLIPVPFVAIFWGLWYQNFSSWVVQADKMDRHLFGREWLPAQIQTVNPIFILVMLPIFSYLVYPALEKVFRLTPLRKINLGLFATAVAFMIVGGIQSRIDIGERPHIIWQILAFVVLTTGEVMVSVTHLEFAYTQAPRKLKSIVMCTYLGAISLGNFFTAKINENIQNGNLKLPGASYFYFFVIVILVAAVVLIFVGRFYKGKTYIQDEVEQGVELR
jgi:POT family proton-dependent oligopeptide transporter